MKKIACLVALIIFCNSLGLAQVPEKMRDTTINNLVHIPGYKTSEYGAIPHFVKSGKGNRTLILIPGWGFDETVFEDFVGANEQYYTMYRITIPGFGKTSAPPMPPAGTSYGEQSWSLSVIQGLGKLIENEGLQKPVIVGHFNHGSQLALRMAIDYPEKIGGVVILGGLAKLIAVIRGKPREYSLDTSIAVIDTFIAPKFWGPIKKEAWDAGNYSPEIYSLDSLRGERLWKQTAAVPLPVLVRYLCELWASDVTLDLYKIKCPVLVLRATFNEKALQNPINAYFLPQFRDSWTRAASKNSLLTIKDVPNAAAFVWKDNPKEVYREIRDFLSAMKQ